MTGCLAVTDGFDGDLGRASRMPRREDGLFACARRGYCAEPTRRVPGDCASAAAAVATALRRAVAGWYGEFPMGASRPPSAGAPAPSLPCRVRGHAPLGARRARRALEKTVEKIVTAPDRTGSHRIDTGVRLRLWCPTPDRLRCPLCLVPPDA
jgi:hypothetical protein